MAHGLIPSPAGGLLKVDGKLATSTDCCCGPVVECAGCSGGYSSTLLVGIDASGATGNPGAVINGCDDGDCQSLTGTYTVTATTGGVTACGITIDSADACCWELPLTEESPQLACVTSSFGGPIYVAQRVIVGQADDDDWYLVLEVRLVDDVGTPSGPTYYWKRNLGSSKPTCASIFPITLTDADYCAPTGFGETITATCILSSIGPITIDLP